LGISSGEPWSGIMSFIHLGDAAAATVLALERDGPAIYNITDDGPAPMREWLPALAAALGAKPSPRRYPLWLGRLLMGDGLAVMTQARGAANAKAQKGTRLDTALPKLAAGLHGRLLLCRAAPVGDRRAPRTRPRGARLWLGPDRPGFVQPPRRDLVDRRRRQPPATPLVPEHDHQRLLIPHCRLGA